MDFSKEEKKEKRRQKLVLQKKYGQRITIAKQGREAFLAKDYVKAATKYTEYLTILADLNDVGDPYKLAPTMFDNKKQITEMLLISHIYWELSRIYEMMPKLQSTYNGALNQFIKFTVNQPYQVYNSEMLRKYIKKNRGVSIQTKALNHAYSQIYVQSKKCYIASLCFGEDHKVTSDLRDFKNILLKNQAGREFVRYYYLISYRIIRFCENRTIAKKAIVFPSIPILFILSKVVRLKWIKHVFTF